jgi:hypothetical protein
MYEQQEDDFPIHDGEESKSTFEDDYFACEVRKPKRGEDPFGEDDHDFMKLLSDPTGEANLFEVVNKIIKERDRKDMLMKIENPIQYIKEKDLFLNEKEMKERVKAHKNAFQFMNHEHVFENMQ